MSLNQPILPAAAIFTCKLDCTHKLFATHPLAREKWEKAARRKLIVLGRRRHAAQNRDKRGLGKPETFKFPGFVRRTSRLRLPAQSSRRPDPERRGAGLADRHLWV